MVMTQDIPAGLIWPSFQFTTAAQGQNSTAAANQLTPIGSGSGIVIMNCTTGTPGTYTTRTGAQMMGDGPLYLGQMWLLLLVNGQGTGTLTLTAGASGITLVNTATIAASTARLFQCQVTAANVLVFTSVWSFTATALGFGVA